MIRTITWISKSPLFSGEDFIGWKTAEHATRKEAKKAAGYYALSMVRIKYREYSFKSKSKA